MYPLGAGGGVRIGGCRYQTTVVCIVIYSLYFIFVIASVGDPTMRSAFLYRSSTRGPEDDSVESKHVAPL